MARHAVRAGRPEPKAVIKAAPSEYEKTHPVGSAERFLDQAAKEALAFAAAGGIPPPSRFIPGAVRAVAKEAEKYPDPLLREAAGLPAKELARRAAHAEAYRKAMDAQNAAVDTVSLAMSPMGNMAANQAAATVHDAATRQDWGGGKNSIEHNRHSKRGTVRNEGAAKDDSLTRTALESGASFIDILRESAGFNSNQEAEDYLEYVAGKRDRFMQDNNQIVKDRAPGLLHADPKSHLKRKAVDYFTFSDEKTPHAPVVKRREKALLDSLFQSEPRGSLRKNSAVGAEEEVSLHPFNTIDQRDDSASLAQLVASGVLGTEHTDRSADLRSRFSAYMQSNQGVYEQMRLTEFQRAVAGLKRKALQHVNAKYKDLSVPERADLASELTRDILRTSRKTYEETEGSYGDKDRAVFSMLKDRFGEVLPTPIPTEDATGFPEQVESAVRAYATAPARAEDRGGLVPRKELYANAFNEKEEKLGPETLKLFRKSRDLMDKVLLENEPDGIDFVDLIDATASFRPLSRQDGMVGHADIKGGDTRQDAEGGDASDPETVSENPETVSEKPETVSGGPRIVINPTTFHNKKDALCVAFNEGFRVWMEVNGFEPQSEPTDAQRKFFSDTAYADDEVQLRRTILARIATFDTSVKDPTDDQLSETASFLGAVLESDWCKNDWERNAVSRLANAVQAAVGAEPVEPRQEPLEAREAKPLQRHAAAEGRQ